MGVRRLVAVTVLVAVLWPVPARADTGADESRFLSLTNQARAQKGVGPLSSDGQLVGIARRWSSHMVAAGSLSHNGNLANLVTEDWQKLGENVGEGPTVDAIQRAFLASPEHYRNIVDPAFTRVGVGVVYAADGTIFVTLDFMQLRSSGTTATTSAPRPTTTRAPATTRPPTTRTTVVPVPTTTTTTATTTTTTEPPTTTTESTTTTTAPPPTTTTTRPPPPKRRRTSPAVWFIPAASATALVAAFRRRRRNRDVSST